MRTKAWMHSLDESVTQNQTFRAFRSDQTYRNGLYPILEIIQNKSVSQSSRRWRSGFKITATSANDRQKKKPWPNRTNTIRYVRNLSAWDPSFLTCICNQIKEKYYKTNVFQSVSSQNIHNTSLWCITYQVFTLLFRKYYLPSPSRLPYIR